MTLNELALYLARKQGDYKFGIPSVSGESSTPTNVFKKILFVFSGDKPEKDFLDTLVEKGLRLKKEDQIYLSSKELSGLDIFKVIAEKQISHAFIFGENVVPEEQAKMFKASGLPCLISPEILKIKESQKLKKDLWDSIKSL